MTVYRPIPFGSPENMQRYLVSDDGRVWDMKKGKFLTQYLRDKKYLSVCLAGGEKGLMVIIHRLVAGAFLPNRLGLLQVNHKNGIKTDNAAENLEWCSCSDNHRHAFREGIRGHSALMRATSSRNVKKAHQARRLFNADDILRMRELHREGVTQREIAEIYNTQQSQVSRAMSGVTYKEIANVE